MGRLDILKQRSQFALLLGRRSLAAIVGLLLALVFLTSFALASTGSNLGAYGTNFAPAELTGQVTNGGGPVAGATVRTLAGHLTTTSAGGNYTLYLDAPGIYTVVAEKDASSDTDTVEVTMGASSVLDLALSGGPSPTPTPTATPTPAPVPGSSGLGLGVMAGLLMAVFAWVYLRRRQHVGDR